MNNIKGAAFTAEVAWISTLYLRKDGALGLCAKVIVNRSGADARAEQMRAAEHVEPGGAVGRLHVSWAI